MPALSSPPPLRSDPVSAPGAPPSRPYPLNVSPERFLGLIAAACGVSALAFGLLIDHLTSSAPGFGPWQVLLMVAGAIGAAAGVGLLSPGGQRLPTAVLHPVAAWVNEAIRFAPVALEVGAVALLLRWFQIESPVFYERIVPMLFGGFLLHHLLPMRFRLAFFVLLSMAGVATVFGATGGAWLIAIGLVLIGICHLPIGFGARAVLLVAVGAVLAGLRVPLLPSPVPEAIWPILGSMFMFRLILYMYELRHTKEPMGATRTVAYFFLLPNVVFPLFPVVDFATFRRTYYDRDAHHIYRTGARWMLAGLTHLLAYRVVYQHLTIPAALVDSGTDLARYMLATFLLYLKVSGQFHLIVGMLHLFGFRLPESHRFFFLASSFTDFWRRINIYWKDFMTKVFYYPSFFRLRKRGETYALVGSTLIVFFSTWALHSYQWFWLLGSVLLSWPDVIFWAILAVLLVANSLHEAKRGRKRSLGGGLPSMQESARHGLAVAGTFTTICVLWSLWSSHTVGDWLHLWGQARLGTRELVAAVVALGVAVLLVAAGHQASARIQSRSRAKTIHPVAPSLALSAAWLAALFLIGSRVFTGQLSLSAQEFARDLRVDKLNQADAGLLHRGYYENLTGVNQFNSRLWEAYAKRPSDWRMIWTTEAVHHTGDFAKWEVAPLVGMHLNGNTMRTNRWGMRDRDYELVPPANIYRIAMTGASFVMGEGVNDHETFESLLEERLNAGAADGTGRYEILNFGAPAYTPSQQLLQLERRIFDFAPNAVFVIGHPYDTQNSAMHTARMFLQGVTIPYPVLDSIVSVAGLRRDMTLDQATERLWRAPFKHDIMRWSLQQIAEACRRRGVQPVWVFVTTPEVRIPPDEIQALKDAAAAAGFIVVDASDAYGSVDHSELRVAPWDAHPNALGHRMIAERLHRALVEDGILEQIRARPSAEQ